MKTNKSTGVSRVARPALAVALCSLVLMPAASGLMGMGSSRDNRDSSTQRNINDRDQQRNVGDRDARIASDLKEAISSRRGMSDRAKNIDVTAQEGRVTLRGQVGSNSESEWIESQARQMSNVRSVQNNLQVSAR